MSESTGEFRFLPGFDTASANNRLMVTGDFSREPDFVGAGRVDETRAHEVLKSLSRKAAFAATVGHASVPESSSPVPQSWEDVTDAADIGVRQLVRGSDLSEYQRQGGLGPEAYEHSTEAARGGISTITAFLEVIPRVEAGTGYADPNTELATLALRSKGFIIEWAGIHSHVDYQLAYALAKVKPHDPGTWFDGMRFNARYFTNTSGRIRINPDKAPNLRGISHTSHPSTAQPGLTALFGCPARRMIPKLYDQMVASAALGGLFEATYREARRNLAYED
jgi:hypothetical protein